MKTKELSFYKHKTKSDTYIRSGRRTWESLYPSVQYFLDKYKWENVLEVGCAVGGLYEIMKKRYGPLKYTGLDINPVEIKEARKRYPDAKFLCANFYNNKIKSGSFDSVFAFLTVSHQRDYKEFISEMIRIAKKRVVFDIRMRYDGLTIADLDTSYLFYLGSGQRSYFVLFNFYELLNYLYTFNLKKISVYGYYAPKKTSAFIPMPRSKLIIASFCLEKDEHSQKLKRDYYISVKRWGGLEASAKRDWCKLDIKLPDFSIKEL